MTTMHRARNWMIKVYGFEHGIPHFHVQCPEGRAVVAIENGTLLAGSVPRQALAEAKEWAEAHVAELRAEWRKLNPDL